MNEAWSAAIKEAMASCPVDVTIIHTLEIKHPSIGGRLFIAQSLVDFEATLETGETVAFEGAGFRFAMPGVGDKGLQELTLAVDNVDQRVGDFCDLAQDFFDPVEVYYRPYLSTDLTQPHLSPPLFLYWKDVTVNSYEVSGRATVSDFINRKFPTELYTRARFPGLR